MARGSGMYLGTGSSCTDGEAPSQPRLAFLDLAPLDLDEIVRLTVGSIRNLLSAECASVLLVESDRNLRFATVDGGDNSLADTRLPFGEGIAGWVAKEGRAVAIADVSKDERFAPRFDESTGFVTKTVVAAPMWLGERLVGVVEAINRTDQRPYQHEDALLLEEVGKHLAIAIVNMMAAKDLAQKNAALESEVKHRIHQVVVAKEEWLQTIDGLRDPIMMVGEDHIVRRANRAFARRSLRSVTEVPGRKCHELLFRQATPCEGCQLHRALAGEVVESELTVGGEAFEVRQAPVSPVHGESGTFVVCGYRDVTESRALERRLRASERLAVVGRLAAGMAHEINNPLAFLSSNLSSLEDYLRDVTGAARRLAEAPIDGPADELEIIDRTRAETVELMKECRDGVGRVAQIVKELGVFGSGESTGTEAIQLVDLVEHAVGEERAACPEGAFSIGGDRALKSWGDGRQLNRAIRAVLRNAVQAAGHADIEVFQLGGSVRIEIRDSGPGISPSIRGHEFEPFVTTRRVGADKGLGLGLSVAHALISAMDGQIRIEPRQPIGTTVIIELPIADNAPRGGTR